MDRTQKALTEAADTVLCVQFADDGFTLSIGYYYLHSTRQRWGSTFCFLYSRSPHNRRRTAGWMQTFVRARNRRIAKNTFAPLILTVAGQKQLARKILCAMNLKSRGFVWQQIDFARFAQGCAMCSMLDYCFFFAFAIPDSWFFASESVRSAAGLSMLQLKQHPKWTTQHPHSRILMTAAKPWWNMWSVETWFVGAVHMVTVASWQQFWFKSQFFKIQLCSKEADKDGLTVSKESFWSIDWG